jgi:hypothetical protein
MLAVNRAARTALGAFGFGLLVAVIAAAAAGDSSTYENLAPTFVYITFWLGTTAVVVLFAFAALKLACSDPGDPRALAVAILAYSTVTWLGILAFGREAWISNGEAFSVYFGFLARIAPLGVPRRTVAVRWPVSGLTGLEVRPGTLASSP